MARFMSRFTGKLDFRPGPKQRERFKEIGQLGQKNIT